MTCCKVKLLLLPGLLLLKMPRILLGLVWDMFSVLFGLLDIDTKPESLLVPGLEFSTEIEDNKKE